MSWARNPLYILAYQFQLSRCILKFLFLDIGNLIVLSETTKVFSATYIVKKLSRSLMKYEGIPFRFPKYCPDKLLERALTKWLFSCSSICVYMRSSLIIWRNTICTNIGQSFFSFLSVLPPCHSYSSTIEWTMTTSSLSL